MPFGERIRGLGVVFWAIEVQRLLTGCFQFGSLRGRAHAKAILELVRDNGKENRNYYRDYIWIMEKKMESTIGII